jgi:DNA mismatch endonuclease (patch repair protein)
VFVNGCFWHRHTGCSRATVPKANNAFWLQKFAANRTRDARAVRALRRRGFRVAIVWECEVGEAETKLRRALEPC